MADLIRWHATVTYRSVHGPVGVSWDLSELEDLQSLVERGPHWDTVERIVIERVPNEKADMTVEEAERL